MRHAFAICPILFAALAAPVVRAVMTPAPVVAEDLPATVLADPPQRADAWPFVLSLRDARSEPPGKSAEAPEVSQPTCRVLACARIPDLDDLRRDALDPATSRFQKSEDLWLIYVHYGRQADYELILLAANLVGSDDDQAALRACPYLEQVQEVVAVDALADAFQRPHSKLVLDEIETALHWVADWPAARVALERRWQPLPEPEPAAPGDADN